MTMGAPPSHTGIVDQCEAALEFVCKIPELRGISLLLAYFNRIHCGDPHTEDPDYDNAAVLNVSRKSIGLTEGKTLQELSFYWSRH